MSNIGDTSINYIQDYPILINGSAENHSPYDSAPNIYVPISQWEVPQQEKNEDGVNLTEIITVNREMGNAKYYMIARAYSPSGVAIIKSSETGDYKVTSKDGKHYFVIWSYISVVYYRGAYNITVNDSGGWVDRTSPVDIQALGTKEAVEIFAYTNGVAFYDNVPDGYFIDGNTDESIDVNISRVDWTVKLTPTFKDKVTISWISYPPSFYDCVNIYVVPFSASLKGDGNVADFDPYPPLFPVEQYYRIVAEDIPWQQGEYVTDYNELRAVCGGYDAILKRPLTLIMRAEHNGKMTALMMIQLEQGAYPSRYGQYSADTTPLDANIYIQIASKGDNIRPPQNNDDDNDDDLDGTEYGRGRELTTTFKIDRETLRKLGISLWTKGILDTTILSLGTAPIENIISVKLMPTSKSTQIVSTIYIGNVTTTLSGLIVEKIHPEEIGAREIPTKYGNFLDFEPYTTTSIFLPFIGFKPLAANYIVGNTISVEYIYDVVAGTCKALIRSNGKPINEYDGECGIDIPITSSNRAAIEAAMITSFIGSVASGSAESALLGISENAFKTPNYESTSSVNSTCAAQLGLKCFIIVDRPVADISSTFAHDYGMICNTSQYISTLKGYTECCLEVDLSHIPCLEEEREKIRELLTGGFYA